METFAILGFVFGLIAFVRTEDFKEKKYSLRGLQGGVNHCSKPLCNR